MINDYSWGNEAVILLNIAMINDHHRSYYFPRIVG